jgi:hypothetical protein
VTVCQTIGTVMAWCWLALCTVLTGCGITVTNGPRSVTLNPGQIPQKDTVQYADATKVGIHVEAGGYGADIGYIKTRVTTVPVCRIGGDLVVPSVSSSVAIGVDLGGDSTVNDTLTVGGPRAKP